MIIVTGGNGQLGHLVVEKLLARVPAEQVGISVRDVEKAADFSRRGVRVRTGDFARPETLTAAFEGATQVLIISSNAAGYGGDPLAQHRSAIDAAKAAGARRVLYTAHMAASATSAFPPMLDHAATEEMLRTSGLAWTSLRNGFYADSAWRLVGEGVKTGVISSPADGKVSWTTHDDLAEAAAIILQNEGQFDGPTPPLTGSQALDLADLAAMAKIRREVISDDELKARMAARGLPQVVARISLGMSIASRNGEFAAVDPTLEKLLGRPPTTMQTFIAGKLH